MESAKATASLSFALKTILSQVVAISTAFIAWPLVQSLPLTLATSTACAYLLVRFLDLPTPWQIANVLLPSMAMASLSVELPGWVFFVPLLVLLLVYAPALWTRVPYYPTPRAAYALLLAELPKDRSFVFLDIGCGFADLLCFLSKHRPQGQFVGVELAFFPWMVAWAKSHVTRSNNISIKFKDIWSYPLHDVDYVYAFLSPAVMERVWEKAQTEMRAGSLFIANSFPVPTSSSDEISVKDGRSSRLYLYKIHGQESCKSSMNS